MLRFASFGRLSRRMHHVCAALGTRSSPAVCVSAGAPRLAAICAAAAPRRAMATASRTHGNCAYCSAEISDLSEMVTLACKHAVHSNCENQARACQICETEHEQVDRLAQNFEDNVRVNTASESAARWDDIPWYRDCPRPPPDYDPKAVRKVTIPVYKQPHLDRFQNVLGGSIESYAEADYPPGPESTEEARPDARKPRSVRMPARMAQPLPGTSQNFANANSGPPAPPPQFGPTATFPNYSAPVQPAASFYPPAPAPVPAPAPAPVTYFAVPPPATVLPTFAPMPFQNPLAPIPLTGSVAAPQGFYVMPPFTPYAPYQALPNYNVPYAMGNLTNFATLPLPLPLPTTYVDPSQVFATGVAPVADSGLASAAYMYNAPPPQQQQQQQEQPQEQSQYYNTDANYSYQYQPVQEEAQNTGAAAGEEEADRPADYNYSDGSDQQNW